MTVAWLRKRLEESATECGSKIRNLQQALLSAAASVQHESANEPGEQLGVTGLPPEPFSWQQQKQSRMDGGQEDDGTLRDHVPIHAPLEQEHLAKERRAAAASNREPLKGTAAFREVPLTGAHQSSFPFYRSRSSFGRLSDMDSNSVPQPAASARCEETEELFTTTEEGQVDKILLPNGNEASDADLSAEAVIWARHYANHVRNGMCFNHEHRCVETCVKKVKDQLEALAALRKRNSVPTCRFCFFRILCVQKLVAGVLRTKKVRRRGKPLVVEPYIESSNDRNDQYRCKVKRAQPFRGATSDVAQACDQCNVDFQFLPCAPIWDETDPSLVAEVSSSGEARPKTPQWLGGVGFHKLPAHAASLIKCFGAVFRKMHAMDFYITKYQGKMMQSLTPLFVSMTKGVRKLEEQENEAQDAKQQLEPAEPAIKKRKTQDDYKRLARQKCLRMASMANRCYWLSTAEIAVYILTGGDAIKTHQFVRIFLRQLQWVVHEAKRILNGDLSNSVSQPAASMTATNVRVQMPADTDTEDEADDAVELEAQVVESILETTSTNFSDDFAHRGQKLQSMPYYVYAMHVERKLRKDATSMGPPHQVYEFEAHYPLSITYVQYVHLGIHVPTIHGFQCPAWEHDPEQNALLKQILFTPWSCKNPMDCGSHRKFDHFLSCNTCHNPQVENDAATMLEALQRRCVAQPSGKRAIRRKYSLVRAWRLRRSELHVLADRAERKQEQAQKYLTLADCTLIAKRYEPVEAVKHGDEVSDALRQVFMKSLARTLPSEALRTILRLSDINSSWHDEQCTLAEYSAQIVRDVAAHIDLAAEARIKEKGNPSESAGNADAQVDSDDGDERTEPSNVLTVEDVGNVGWEDDNHGDIEELNDSLPLHPLRDHEAALRCVFQTHMVDAAKKKNKRLSDAERDCLHLSELYESQTALHFGLTQADLAGMGPRTYGITLGEEAASLFSLQKARIEAMRKTVAMEVDGEDENDDCFTGVFQPRNEESKIVPLPLAQQGPAALAWHLLQEINATSEQIDAVSLFALSLQRRFDSRPDKTSLLLPIATATGNHEALWLGGGGVGKTRTLTQVVEPMAVTYFGKNGYLATAQANHAAQQLGPRGRTLHTANGLLATSSLQTAKLALNEMSRKNWTASKAN